MTAFEIGVDILTDALGPVSALVDECKLRFDDDGLSITAVDPANVAMVDMTINRGAFDGFESDDRVLGVNLERLEDVLSMADSGDVVKVSLDQETRKLDIDIGGLSYTLALIDPDSIRQEPDIPDLDLPATVVVEGRQISRGVSAADLCSDHITLQAAADEETFYINAEGDTDDVSLALGDDDLLSANVSESCESMFSLDYLSDMERAMPSDGEISLRLGTEVPVKMRYSLADGSVEVVNMLAPRISSE
ncbi:PCNA-like protein [environmental Halophage eHP-11]|nr:PCNA-like protein [environmental Halophage eHP-11]